MLCDVCAITVAFLLSFWVRGYLLAGYLGGIYPFGWYLWIYLAVVLSFPFVFVLLKQYDVDGVVQQEASLIGKAGRLFQGVILEFLLLSALAFTFKLHYVSRLLAVLFIILSFFLLFLARAFIWPILFSRVQEKALGVLVVGTGESALALAAILAKRPRIGIRLVGFLSESPTKLQQLAGHPVLGSLDEAEYVFSNHVIDEVMIAIPEKSLSELETFLLLCEELGITARLACDFLPRGSARLYLEELENTPLLTFATTPNNPSLLVIKRIADVVLSLFLLVLTSPLFLIVPLLIKLTSKGPVLHRQVRCGLNGRKFDFSKFRSMVEGAEELRKEIEHLNEAKEPVFKISSDPRVTGLGKILRRTSIDELPQLINVLKGEMSLVGPRPPLPQEVERYQPWQRRRLSMKPGLTCLWQVSGRSELGFDEWVALDLHYIDHWSPWLDFQILFRTVPAVLLGKGAR
jgi:exopolysaccharide biosynthesis polyprenyl glycosylphosphotransferase